MSLKDIELKKAYDSDVDDILDDFYIPALSHSVTYKRLAGFFSSSALAVAARGISKLISNGGHMKLITSAKLRKSDIEAIREAYENPEKVIEKMVLEDLGNLEDKFVEDHVRALGWMVAKKKLEIKIAIVYGEDELPLDEKSIEKEGLFHQKVGILEDMEGNQISFSGSDNESATAWQRNIEEFKIFRGWVEGEKEYFDADRRKFEKFWAGYPRRTKVIDVPRAVKEKLIKIAPDNIEVLNLEKWSKRKGERRKKMLWKHQKDAINNWLANGGKGIFEMATGAGKTLAALGCLKRISEIEKKLIIVITCPTKHLLKQWESEIRKFGIDWQIIIADSSNLGWKDRLVDYLRDIENDISEKIIILTTPNTLSSTEFTKIIKETSTKAFLIGDEVHTLGAPERQKGLLDKYELRLGLSATPKRYFDEPGSKKLFEYFGDEVSVFSLKDAITTVNPSTGETYLAPYEYKPYFVEMTDEEFYRYQTETKKIVQQYYSSKTNEKRANFFRLLCIKRQEIVKNARNKYTIFKRILDEVGNDVKYCFVYCSPQQIKRVQRILNERDIIQHKFTAVENVAQREILLRKLAEGEYQVLVAMKCLDEGVDIPPTRIGILLSSSGNPREYIQRRGRLLRRFPGKEKAIVYDIIVLPSSPGSFNPDFFELERKIFAKELKRYEDFAYDAKNTFKCLEKVKDMSKKYNV